MFYKFFAHGFPSVSHSGQIFKFQFAVLLKLAHPGSDHHVIARALAPVAISWQRVSSLKRFKRSSHVGRCLNITAPVTARSYREIATPLRGSQ